MIQDSESNPDWFTAQRLVPALVLIAVGGIFLLSNLHMMRVHDIWQYWPVIPMVIGVFRLVDAKMRATAPWVGCCSPAGPSFWQTTWV